MSEYIVSAQPGHLGRLRRARATPQRRVRGCWCTYFHTMHSEKTFDADDNRNLKRRLVEEGRAHAALVYDGNESVAWCEYGSPEELPNIYHRKQYWASPIAARTAGLASFDAWGQNVYGSRARGTASCAAPV